ncbi:hypothetical protein ACV341_32970, partial [Pseudomonas aeruginosa]
DAWLDLEVEPGIEVDLVALRLLAQALAAVAQAGELAAQMQRGLLQVRRRDLACLLLADLSMSTEAYLDDQRRVIDS